MPLRLLPVEKDELPELYKLNRILAAEEGQGDLFVADFGSYRRAFLGPCPLLRAHFIEIDGERAGFAIHHFKFATYTGRKVLYIEDLYLLPPFRDERTIDKLLHKLEDLMRELKCRRIELRVLDAFSLGKERFVEAGFQPVEKWRVYRKDPLSQTGFS
ncbi:GNAT family N-acetyltransferase [Nitratifractor sp.]